MLGEETEDKTINLTTVWFRDQDRVDQDRSTGLECSRQSTVETIIMEKLAMTLQNSLKGIWLNLSEQKVAPISGAPLR